MKRSISIVVTIITITTIAICNLCLFTAKAETPTKLTDNTCYNTQQNAIFERNVQTYIFTNAGYKEFAVRELWRDCYGNLFILHRGTYSNITAPVSYASNNYYFKYTFYMSGGWEYFN